MVRPRGLRGPGDVTVKSTEYNLTLLLDSVVGMMSCSPTKGTDAEVRYDIKVLREAAQRCDEYADKLEALLEDGDRPQRRWPL